MQKGHPWLQASSEWVLAVMEGHCNPLAALALLRQGHISGKYFKVSGRSLKFLLFFFFFKHQKACHFRTNKVTSHFYCIPACRCLQCFIAVTQESLWLDHLSLLLHPFHSL